MSGTGILFAIISSLSFGISNVYWKKAVVNDDFSRVVFYRGVMAVTVFLSLLLMLNICGADLSPWVKPGAASLRELGLTFLLCSVCSLGLVFFLRSLRFSVTAIAVMLSSINVFSILTAVLVLCETFRPVYFLSFSLAGLGVWLINRNSIRQAKGWNRGVLYSLLASFFWGVTYALFKYPANSIGALPLSILLETAVAFTALIWNITATAAPMRISVVPPLRQFGHYAVLALLLIAGTLCFNLAIQCTDVLLLSLLGNISLITSIVLGFVWLKERVGWVQLAGIASILVSLLVVQLV